MKLVLGMLIAIIIVGAANAIFYANYIDYYVNDYLVNHYTYRYTYYYDYTYEYISGSLLVETLLHTLPILIFYIFVYIGINGSEKNHKGQKILGIIGCSIFFLFRLFIIASTSDFLFQIFSVGWFDIIILIISITFISISSRYNGKTFSIIAGILAVIYFLLIILIFFLSGSSSFSVQSEVLYEVSSVIQPLLGLILLVFACLPSDRRIHSKDNKPKSEIEKYLDEIRGK